jgi:Putative prokaryotic signal transducing protein
MKELLRSNDAVKLSWIEAVLRDAGIAVILLDTHASFAEGSIGAIQRRLMVDDDDLGRAKVAIAEAERDLPG